MQQSVFERRRLALFEKMSDNSVALLPSAKQKHRNADTEYPFRQDSHFYYVTGFDESNAIALLLKKGKECRYMMFCQERNPSIEQWVGSFAGIEGACEQYGADFAYPITEVERYIPELLSGIETIYFLMNSQLNFDKKIFLWIKKLAKKIRSGIGTPYQLIDLRVILDEHRLIKSEEEIERIQKACDISINAHQQAMARCHAGMKEYELEAILLQEFYRQGCRSPAYPSIVAGGENACTLHYTRNNETLNKNELVLIDAGAEYDFYAADITRTFPISGKFTASQQAIYELVLEAQVAAIKLVSPKITWDAIQSEIIKILVCGLVDLKILKGNVESLIEQKAYLPFYMHNSGHWLGLDVHDVGNYKLKSTWRQLKPNMVLTIEPGLYFDSKNKNTPEKFKGIGVRIEDDILVTENKGLNLTQRLPKSVEDLEKIIGRVSV